MLEPLSPPLFADRRDAGRRLGQALHQRAHELLLAPAGSGDVLVLALPRGGAPVGAAVAQALEAPLDLWLVRKLGLPGQPEYAMGAIASGDARVLNTATLERLAISASALDTITRAELRELHRRERLYRGHRPWPEIAGRTVVLVDDGLATGATMRAAVAALRKQSPARIVVAVPVAAPDTCQLLHHEADKVLCLYTPERFRSVGQWYEDFDQVSDAEVRECLEQQATMDG